jgi:hypothetical protein
MTRKHYVYDLFMIPWILAFIHNEFVSRMCEKFLNSHDMHMQFM